MAALKLDESPDSLQMKLHLKKQIWTGAWNEQAIDRTRPLSWGHTGIKTNHYLELREYDSEQLLIACSRKLLAWQEDGKTQGQGHTGSHNNKQKNKATGGGGGVGGGGGITVTHDRRLNRDTAKGGRMQKGFHVSTASFINRCNITRITELGKGKKLPQNYAMAKIVEATDFMTGRTTTTTVNGQKKRASVLPGTTTTGNATNRTTTTTTLGLTTTKKKSKFKTSGIVVTAVQNHAGVPPKRIRSILPTHRGTTNNSLTSDEPQIGAGRDQIKNLAKKIRIRKKSKA